MFINKRCSVSSCSAASIPKEMLRRGLEWLLKNKSTTITARPAIISVIHLAPLALRAVLALGCLIPTWGLSAASAAAEDRSLKLFFGHTGERAVITFKRDGVYDQNGLNQLNQFLRDWRRNETIKMDPLLFDIVWEMYKRSGATGYVNVVSGYRSPGTNAMLRSWSSGVAKESQHTRGKAIDFFIPSVKLATLRGLGMQMQDGGVGYYPTSGSPFVHIDVGRVRAWPRMSRQELVRLFPDGRTLHIPSDGRPLPGYAFAVADYKRRGSVSNVEFASAAPAAKNVMGSLSPGVLDRTDPDEEGDALEKTLTATAPASTARGDESVTVAVVGKRAEFNAPVPASRPPGGALLTTLVPTELHPSHQALESFASGGMTAMSGESALSSDAGADEIPLPAFASREATEKRTNGFLIASIEPLPDGIASLAGVPLPSTTGATALLAPVLSDHLPIPAFSVSYKNETFRTASFTPTATFDRRRFGEDPCVSMTASKATELKDQPC